MFDQLREGELAMGDTEKKNSHDSCSDTGDACRESGAGDARTIPDRRVVRTRRAIRKAFLRLMQDTEYQKITITAIAREADIDRKTFYLHYQSIDELTDEIVQEEADRIVSTCLDSLKNSGDGNNVVTLFEKLSLGLAPDLKSVKRIASHVPYELVLKKLESSLTASLIEQDTLGLKKLGPYLDFCVAYFSAGLVAVIRRWIMEDSEIPLEDIAQMTHAIVHSGLDGIVKDVASDDLL